MQSSDRDPELPPTYRDWKHYAKTCSDGFAEWRDKCETQTRLRVEAALEARIQTLEGRILAAHTPDEARRLLRP